MSIEKNEILNIIAANLKKLLQQSEISPSELARKCHVSGGSISKIAKGTMSITIPMAMNLAKGLGVELNDLLEGLVVEEITRKSPEKNPLTPLNQWSIGVLSINNKRITCIKNHEGQVIGNSELEGGLDLTESTGHLLQAIQESIFAAYPDESIDHSLLKGAKLKVVTQSFEFVDARTRFKAFAQKHFREVILLPDWQLSYLSAFGVKHGISLIVDKGVSLSYQHHGQLKKLGGWKFPVYDLGGENWLGLETIRHTIEAAEGYVPMSALAHQILTKFNGRIEKITETCLKGNNPDIYCLFVESLIRYYFTGDKAAEAILKRGFQLIQRSVDRVVQILGKTTQIALTGSLTDIYKPFFNQNLLVVSSSDLEKACFLADITETLLADA